MVFWVQDGADLLFALIIVWLTGSCGLCVHTLMENMFQVPFICLSLFSKCFTYTNSYTFLDSLMTYTLFSPFTYTKMRHEKIHLVQSLLKHAV